VTEQFPETSAGERRQLLGLAYRLLGSAVDAEDAVQEAYVRLYRLAAEAREQIDAPGAWLMTATGRICLDVLGSARARRESYVGEWLPEPLPGSDLVGGGTAAGDPAERVSMDESVSMALMVVLDTLTPAERVAFVLHDVFQYSFAEIAEIVGRTPQACRQLASSARSRIAKARTEPHVDARRGDILRAFKSAWETGDMEGLIDVLDPSVVVIADGGGKAQAALRPIHGPDRIVRFLESTRERGPELFFEETTVNGEEGLVARDAAGAILVVMAFGIVDDRIQHIWAMRNPDKLVHWS
jgi:RNA polymerase sigma-70 factor (ECF subfamily)